MGRRARYAAGGGGGGFGGLGGGGFGGLGGSMGQFIPGYGPRVSGESWRQLRLAPTRLKFAGTHAAISRIEAAACYSLIVCTTLEVGRASPPPEPFICFKIASS